MYDNKELKYYNFGKIKKTVHDDFSVVERTVSGRTIYDNEYIFFIVIWDSDTNIGYFNNSLKRKIWEKISKIGESTEVNDITDFTVCVFFFSSEKKCLVRMIRDAITRSNGRARLLTLGCGCSELIDELTTDEVKLLKENKENLKCYTEEELFDKFEKIVLGISLEGVRLRYVHRKKKGVAILLFLIFSVLLLFYLIIFYLKKRKKQKIKKKKNKNNNELWFSRYTVFKKK